MISENFRAFCTGFNVLDIFDFLFSTTNLIQWLVYSLVSASSRLTFRSGSYNCVLNAIPIKLAFMIETFCSVWNNSRKQKQRYVDIWLHARLLGYIRRSNSVAMGSYIIQYDCSWQQSLSPFSYICLVLCCRYSDVIMTTIASQITNLTIVYSIVYSDADQRKHQSSASLAFVCVGGGGGGFTGDRWIPRTKGQ